MVMPNEIDELVFRATETAGNKGFHDPMPTFGELVALCHSELSEMLEEFRKEGYTGTDEIQEEAADVCIRIFDMAGIYGWNLRKAIYRKMEKNKNRPFRHGGKVL